MDFLCERGVVYQVGADRGGSMYAVQGLTDSQSDSSHILINTININESDDVAPISTLNNQHVLYVFGESFGNVTIEGELLLGALATEGTGGTHSGHRVVQQLQSWFKDNRVSSKAASVSLSIGKSGAFNAYLTSLAIMTPNPELQIMPFRVTGIKGP